jgi:hypothetical protein
MDDTLGAICDDLASRSDDFLAGIRDRAQARPRIAEELTLEYPGLDPAARAAIINGVMWILEDEDFFGIQFVGDPFSEPADAVDE